MARLRISLCEVCHGTVPGLASSRTFSVATATSSKACSSRLTSRTRKASRAPWNPLRGNSRNVTACSTGSRWRIRSRSKPPIAARAGAIAQGFGCGVGSARGWVGAAGRPSPPRGGGLEAGPAIGGEAAGGWSLIGEQAPVPTLPSWGERSCDQVEATPALSAAAAARAQDLGGRARRSSAHGVPGN